MVFCSLAGDFGFDPLGLGEDPRSLKWYVQAELVHGRFAMAGVAGILVTDVSISAFSIYIYIYIYIYIFPITVLFSFIVLYYDRDSWFWVLTFSAVTPCNRNQQFTSLV